MALKHERIYLLANVLLQSKKSENVIGIYVMVLFFATHIRQDCALFGGIDEQIEEGQTLLLAQIIIRIGHVVVVIVVVCHGQLRLALANHHV